MSVMSSSLWRAVDCELAWPVCTTAGVSRPIQEWQCSSLCQRKNPRQKSSPWKVPGEAVWEVGPVLERLELALGEGVVGTDMGSAVGLGSGHGAERTFLRLFQATFSTTRAEAMGTADFLQRFNANTSTPAPTMRIPSQSRTDGRSWRKSTANTATSTRLSLSTGATLEASPIFKARK